MSGEIGRAGRPTAYPSPDGFEGRVRDRGNPAPLDRFSPAAVVLIEVLTLGSGLGAGVLLAAYGVPIWVMPVLFGIVSITLLVRVGGVSLLGRLAHRVRRSPAALPEPVPAAVELPDGTALGVIRSGRLLISVLAVRDDAPAITVDGTRPVTTVPVDLLVDHLSRYDISLHSIDVTTGVPGSRPTGSTTWVTVRFDPARDPGAVDRRGGGDEGAVRTLVTATRRLALRLAGEGLAVTALDAAAITRDRARFTAGDRTGVATVVRPDRAVPADPGAGGVSWLSLRGRDRAGRVHWCAALTVPEGGRSPDGTVPVDPGAEVAMAAMTPGSGHTGRSQPRFHPLLDPVGDVARWSAGPDGHGPLLGVDADGRGVRLGLHGHSRRIGVDVSRHTLLQLLLRALRGGAAVEIVTSDPSAWDGLRHPDHELILRAPGDSSGSGDVPDLVVVAVVEGTDAPHTRCATVLSLLPSDDRNPPAAATLTENHGDAAGSVTVTADGRTLDVGLIELPGESEVIGRPETPVPA